MVALVGAVAGCTSGEGGSDGGDDGAGEARRTTGTTEVVAVDGWKPVVADPVEVPDPPRSNPNAPLVAIDGGFLLEARYEDAGSNATPAQVFDPEAGRWIVLPPDPVDDPILFASTTSVPGGFLTLGSRCRTTNEMPDTSDGVRCKPGNTVALRYDLEGSSWTELDLPAPAPPIAGSVDSEFDVIAARAGGDEVLVRLSGLWNRYDAAADEWDRVDPPSDSISGERTDECATSAGLVSVDAPGADLLGNWGGSLPTIGAAWRAQLLQDDGTWSYVSAYDDFAGMEVPPMAVVVCAGPGVVVLLGGGGVRAALRFDPSASTWAEAARPPFQVGLGEAAVLEEGAVIRLSGEAEAGKPGTFVYDWAADAWTESPFDVPTRGVFAAAPDGLALGSNVVYADGDPRTYQLGRLQP